MTPEELLKPRFKVISDYPKSTYKIGLIVEPNEGDSFNQYPNIFKPLEWWEEREAKDMPLYIKEAEKHIKKARYFFDGGKIRMVLNNDDKGWLVTFNIMCFFEPASEQEYLNQIKMEVI